MNALNERLLGDLEGGEGWGIVHGNRGAQRPPEPKGTRLSYLPTNYTSGCGLIFQTEADLSQVAQRIVGIRLSGRGSIAIDVTSKPGRHDSWVVLPGLVFTAFPPAV